MLEDLMKHINNFVTQDIDLTSFIDAFKEHVIKVIRDTEYNNKMSSGELKKALATQALIEIYDTIDKHFNFPDMLHSLFKDKLIPIMIDYLVKYLNEQFTGWDKAI